MTKRRHQLKKQLRQLLIHVFLLLVAVLELYPVILMGFNSLKSTRQFYLNPFGLPNPVSFENLKAAFEGVNYLNALKNNLIILSFTLAAIVLFASMAAYPLAKRDLLINNGIYIYFLSGLVLPTFTALIPLLNLMKSIGLSNSYFSLVIIYTAGAMPFTIIFYSGFYKAIPSEIEDAALIDGAGMVKVYILVYMPLLKTATATICILQCVGVWNDFLHPYLFLSKTEMRTLMPALYTYFGSQILRTKWEFIFPAMLLITMPLLVVFLVANKSFIKAMVEGAVKG